jgi:hypothetical protein
MARKVRKGMLCKFKSNIREYWYGYHEPELLNHVVLSKQYVTVVKKAGVLLGGHWVSQSQVIGVDTAGNAVIVWILSHSVKPHQESLSSQSKD